MSFGYQAMFKGGSIRSNFQPANNLHAFLLGCRLGLWWGIILNAMIFGFIFSVPLTDTIIVGIILAITASFGFLINDALDTEIDAANHRVRWRPMGLRDYLVVTVIGVLPILLTLIFLSNFGVLGVIVLLLVWACVVLYSIHLNKLFLLKNALAATLCLSPIWVVFVLSPEKTILANDKDVFFMFAGLFLFLFSRELRFDEFDVVGDKHGKRLTLPSIFPQRSLMVVHLCCSIAGGVLLMTNVPDSSVFKIGAFVAAACLTILMIWPIFTNDKTRYFIFTRLGMLAAPIYALLSLA